MFRLFQAGLGGRAEKNGCVADLRKKIHSQIEQGKHIGWHRLHFIQNENAVRQRMEPAYIACFIQKDSTVTVGLIGR